VGIAGVIRKYKPVRPSAKTITISGGHYFRIFSSGFLINTFNPGVIIIWLGSVTATANTTSLYRFVLFGTCLGLILSIDILKVFLADAIRRKLTLRRIMYLQKASAICTLSIGIALLFSTALNIHFKQPEIKQRAAYQQIQSAYNRNFSKA
jgi:threonine/homoserine/homoserine lactone efflux protein